ncbi:hypothetical protein JTB14_019340 [Gonioctena quinquepunctata]|nr:hypothetical protein JTB14_019340 [Gonioctena quinquepunctata]
MSSTPLGTSELRCSVQLGSTSRILPIPIRQRSLTKFPKTDFNQLSHQILDSNESVLKREDRNKSSQSDYPYFYKSFPSPNGLIHLKSPNHISIIRTIAQLRACSNVFTRFTANGCLYTIRTDEICSICNLGVNETVVHIIFECPTYESLRLHLYSQITTLNDLVDSLDTGNPKTPKIIVNYISAILKLRSFIINE